MTAPARRLLALLGVLPDGITHADLTDLLPEGALPAAAVLRQLGLAFDEGTRLRMLAPVREHTATTHSPEPADLERVVGYYAHLAATGIEVGGREGAQVVTRLQAETGNIAAMLSLATATRRIGELATAVWGLTEYWKLAGLAPPPLTQTMHDAINANGTAIQQASTWFALADLAGTRSDLDGARVQFERALRLYRQAGDVQGEADCIKGLGDIVLDRSDSKGARAQYERALPLYQAIPEPFSIGWTLVRLARLDPPGEDRTRHWHAAREAWASIGRQDLVQEVQDEFGPRAPRKKRPKR